MATFTELIREFRCSHSTNDIKDFALCHVTFFSSQSVDNISFSQFSSSSSARRWSFGALSVLRKTARMFLYFSGRLLHFFSSILIFSNNSFEACQWKKSCVSIHFSIRSFSGFLSIERKLVIVEITPRIHIKADTIPTIRNIIVNRIIK